MRYGFALALAVGLAGCGDDPPMAQPDLSAIPDLSMMAQQDAGEDMSAEEPATAQITVADVVGVAYAPVPGTDAGVAIPAPVHSLAVVVDFPASAGTAQHSSGSALNGCTWNRFNNLPPGMGGTGPFPPPNENAGTVTVTGYDTKYTIATDTLNPAGQPAPVDPTINCAFNATTFHFDCYFGTDPTHQVGRYIFPTTPYALIPSPTPSPLPSPAPPAWNTDLFKSGYTNAMGMPDTMVNNALSESFTPAAQSTYSDARTTNLTALPKAPHVVAVNTMAQTTEELTALTGLLDGTQDVTIDYSCDGTSTKGAGCSLGGITGLLIQTSLGPKHLAPNLLRFGTAQCVDTDNGMATHTFTLPKEMIAEILGSDTNQSIRVVLVRLKANATSSGAHAFYQTAGRGTFAFIDQ